MGGDKESVFDGGGEIVGRRRRRRFAGIKEVSLFFGRGGYGLGVVG